MRKNNFDEYFNNLSFDLFDIRQTKDGTWIDQKCTPDVIAFVADSIVEYVEKFGIDIEDDSIDLKKYNFKIKDIELSEYSKQNIYAIYKKPEVKPESNEYDKFFSQPIKLLLYAQVLGKEESKSNFKIYIKNPEILICLSEERKALSFLQCYIEKVLIASDLFSQFKVFFDKQDNNSLNKLKNDFYAFMVKYTPKGNKGGGQTECNRIIPKILNPLSFKYSKKGLIRGRLSNDVIQKDSLFYNRENFRDIYANKPKGVARKDYIPEINSSEQKTIDYYSNLAKKTLKRYNKKYNNGLSECYLDVANNSNGIDEIFEQNELKNLATQIHHIFPKSSFPNIAGNEENLIALTPNQHTLKAHPGNNTQIVDEKYQNYLIKCKILRIKNAFDNDYGSLYYWEDLIDVLNIGYETTEFSSIEKFNFSDLEEKLSKFSK